ncbi:MAG: hypothetical protein IAE91_00110, partial [Ignavibacteriaceae bacterium]|nr:hypothetical protein [Ignavibacteriaceae bacterium]
MSQDKKIVPSIIVYNGKMEQVPKFGEEAEGFIASGYPVFMSLKKLVGINSGISIKHSEYEYEVTSNDASKKFVELLLEKFSVSNPNFSLSNVIICVPNTFTENKIQRFKDLIPSKIYTKEIRRKRHIYESEAVIVNWLNSSDENRKNNCNIMVCDLGGGTINITIAEVKINSPVAEISLLSRFGASKGGEEVTRYIANFIWEKLCEDNDELAQFDPVNKSLENNLQLSKEKLDEYNTKFTAFESTLRNLKLYLFQESEKIKFWFSETTKSSANNKQYSFSAPEFVKKITNYQSITIDSVGDYIVSNNTEFKIELSKKKFKALLDGETESDKYKAVLEDLINSSLSSISNKGIDKLIITGRSSFTLGVKDLIKNKVEKYNQYLNLNIPGYAELDIDESKLFVAKGAAIYAAKPTEYRLSRNKSLANYCIFYKKNNNEFFYPVIKINEEFKVTPGNPEKYIEYPGNNLNLNSVSRLEIVQILGDIENPPKHKITTITKVKNQYISGNASVNFRLSDKDKIKWKIDSETASLVGEDN